MQPEIQDANLQQSIDDKKSLGEKICQAMIKEVGKLEFATATDISILFEDLDFSIGRDTYSQHDTLEGSWAHPVSNSRLGSILFHGDGTFYAEHDVLLEHPTDKRWFVEAVTAWGKDDSVKTELRLLPVPE